MANLTWLVVALAALSAGYMAFDGARALVVRDFLTPSSGPYAGQLGPWHKLASAVGIGPRSTLMKSIFLGHGLAWLGVVVAFAAGASWAWWAAMLVAAVGAAWNLWFGTAASVAIVALLVIPAVRQAFPS